jgi:hypothetical protein
MPKRNVAPGYRNSESRPTYVFPWVFSQGHTRCTKGDPLIKALVITGFQFLLIWLCVQLVSDITFTYLDKNVP